MKWSPKFTNNANTLESPNCLLVIVSYLFLVPWWILGKDHTISCKCCKCFVVPYVIFSFFFLLLGTTFFHTSTKTRQTRFSSAQENWFSSLGRTGSEPVLEEPDIITSESFTIFLLLRMNQKFRFQLLKFLNYTFIIGKATTVETG